MGWPARRLKWGGGLLLGTYPTGNDKNNFSVQQSDLQGFRAEVPTSSIRPEIAASRSEQGIDAKQCIVIGPQVEIDGNVASVDCTAKEQRNG